MDVVDQIKFINVCYTFWPTICIIN